MTLTDLNKACHEYADEHGPADLLDKLAEIHLAVAANNPDCTDARTAWELAGVYFNDRVVN